VGSNANVECLDLTPSSHLKRPKSLSERNWPSTNSPLCGDLGSAPDA
jgi:hypothetical protein